MPRLDIGIGIYRLRLCSNPTRKFEYVERPRNSDGAFHKPSKSTSVAAENEVTGGGRSKTEALARCATFRSVREIPNRLLEPIIPTERF
jgi:hypothetical protein